MTALQKPSSLQIHSKTYRDKVLGCWTGKNIGGTLGEPFEGSTVMNTATFYTRDLRGNPAPNDDLDLQLVWLLAAEETGLYRLNERILGEYWLTHITGPWNEYGVSKANMRAGFFPPVSGSCSNERWHASNGAWIRSEIWACLFPGCPSEAVRFAYMDACCDHSGDGIYAELFTAAMQSAAFVLDDIRQLIEVGLAHVPADCRVARSVRLACACHDKGDDFPTAREAIVQDSADLGWFQAPGNLGFVILGLLYGEGNFGRSVCLANNCGDDTDCTAGTVGSLLGIVKGRSGIPAEWITPIGESIITCSIDTYGRNNRMPLPKTLAELTDRVICLAHVARRENPLLPCFTDAPAVLPDEERAIMTDPAYVREHIWTRSAHELSFDLPYGRFSVEYEDGPEATPDEPKRLILRMHDVRFVENTLTVRLQLPEGWRVEPCSEGQLWVTHTHTTQLALTLIPGEFPAAHVYVGAELRLSDRMYSTSVQIPFRRKGSVEYNPSVLCRKHWDDKERYRAIHEKQLIHTHV